MDTELHPHQASPNHAQISLTEDPEHSAIWVGLNYRERPCFTPSILQDLVEAQRQISLRARSHHRPDRLRYQIVLSRHRERVFSLGGDLAHFLDLITRADRAGLKSYAETCIDVLFACASHYEVPFTTIALVQGQALGGGFEAALSQNVLIAERSAEFGFPETLFGMFPGMGAYSFLSRKLNPGMAKRLITGARIYRAEELYDMGVVDVLAETGQGEAAVRDYIRHEQSRAAGFHAVRRLIDRVHPLSRQELVDIAEIWVDTALRLSHGNLRMMKYLLQAQRQQAAETPHAAQTPEVLHPTRAARHDPGFQVRI